MNEIVQQQPRKLSFSQYVNSKSGMALISNAIKNPEKREAFVTAIVSAVAANPALQECTAPSIISAALQGVALNLAPSPQLGEFYMVPYKNKKAGTTEAQFICGKNGYIQLALRSGQYLRIGALPVVEGEYKGLGKDIPEPCFEWIDDDELRDSLPVVGYVAYYELMNGARKLLYWSKRKMIDHADTYVPAFSKNATNGKYPKVSFEDYEAGNYPKGDEWKYNSLWYGKFNDMALKTVLRQLIKHWGPKSVEMETAINQEEAAQEDGYELDFASAAMPAPVTEPQEVPEATDGGSGEQIDGQIDFESL